MNTKQSTSPLAICPVCGGTDGVHQAMNLHERNGAGGGRNILAMCPWAPEEIARRATDEAMKRAEDQAYFDGLFPPVIEIRAA